MNLELPARSATKSSVPGDCLSDGDAVCARARLHATLLKHLTGAVYRCRNDGDWTVEFISDGCLEVTGYRADELIGNRVTSLGAIMHPGDAPAVWEKYQANLAAHRVCSSEYRILHRGGGERWVWDQAQGIYSASGELLFIEGLLTDITPRKQAETQALTFAALGRQLNGATSARAAAEIVLAAAQRVFSWDAATVDLYSAETDTVEFVVNRDTLDGRRLDVAPAVPGGPPTARGRKVLREGAQLILREPPFAFGKGDVPTGDTSRPSASIMAVPVRQEASVVGLLSIQSYTPRAYTCADLGTLQSLADYCGGAFHRIQTREALQEAEAKYRAIFDGSPLGLYQTTPAGKILTANPAMARILGYASPEELLRERTDVGAQGYVHPERRDEFKRLLEARGEVPHFEYEARRKDGNTVWVAESARAIRGADGRVVCYEGTFEDITGRKQAAAALGVAHRRAQSLAALGCNLAEDSTPKAAAKSILEAATDLLDWDCAWLELWHPDIGRFESVLNYDLVAGRRVEFTPSSPDALEPTPIARRVMAEGAQLVLRAGPADEPAELRPFGTGRRSLSLLFAPIRNCGRLIGIVSIQSYRPQAYALVALELLQALADHCGGALERIATQQALRASEERLRLAVQASNVGLWDWDVRTDRVVFSREWKSQLGYAEQEIGNAFSEWESRVHPDDLAPALGRLRRALVTSEGVHEVEFRMRHKDGSWRWIYTRAEVFRDPQGRAIRMVGCHVDITGRKQAVAEVVQLSGRLLRAQDEERRRLAREIHDSTAQTFAALAMNLAVLGRISPGLDDASRALLAECEAQVRRGTGELRTFAYLLHPPALEALGLTRAIHDYAEGFAKRSGIRMELDVPEIQDRLPRETELTLFRVLQESLGNIHRHSGSPTAAIRLAQDAETVALEVRDAGRGLDGRQLAAVHGGDGSVGVGFAGMRERLRLLGGRLEIEPALPGLRVRATLPLAAGTAGET